MALKIGLPAVLAAAVIGAASWEAGQRPYLTPGNDQIFREGATLGAMLGFLLFPPYWSLASAR